MVRNWVRYRHGGRPKRQGCITVRPDLLMDGVFTALEQMGLRIRQVECEAVSGYELPFMQQFEFVPVDGPFHGRWRELEVMAYRSADDLQLWFAIDRKQQGLSGMLSSLVSTGELKRQLRIPHHLPPQQAGQQVVEFLQQST